MPETFYPEISSSLPEDYDTLQDRIEEEFEIREKQKDEKSLSLLGFSLYDITETENYLVYEIPESTIHRTGVRIIRNTVEEEELRDHGKFLAATVRKATDRVVKERDYDYFKIEGDCKSEIALEDYAANHMVGAATRFFRNRSEQLDAKLHSEVIKWLLGEKTQIPALEGETAETDGFSLTGSDRERMENFAEEIAAHPHRENRELTSLKWVDKASDHQTYGKIKEIINATDPNTDQEEYEHLPRHLSEQLENLPHPNQRIENMLDGMEEEFERLEEERGSSLASPV